jgi:hypothetical protein
MAKRISMAIKPSAPTADQWVSGDAIEPIPVGSPDTPKTPSNFEAQSPVTTSIVEEGAPGAESPTQTGAMKGEDTTPMKRLTLDIPEELHARIKSQCALRRTKMVDEIRAILETHFTT